MKTVLSKISIDLVFFYLLAIFILGLPYNIGAWWIGTFSIVLFILTITNPLRKKTIAMLFNERILQILFIFILFTYISVFWSKSPVFFNGDLHTNIARFKYYFLIIPAIYLSNLSKKEINKLFIITALAPALSIVIYYTNHFGFSKIFAAQNPNSNLLLRHYLIQNFFILFSILFLYIRILLHIEKKSYKKTIIYFILFLIASISLVIDSRTESRLMDLVFLIILISVPFYYFPPKVYFPFLIILLVISSLIMINSSPFQRGMDNFTQAVESNVYTASWGHRTGYLLAGIEIYKQNPIIGRGINDITRPMNEMAIEKPEYFKGEFLRHFHDEHINILVASGLVGYILLIYFLFLLFRLKLENRNAYVFKNITIIIIFFTMLGEHYLTFKSTTNFFSILIALFITYSNIEKEENKSPHIT